MDEERVFSLSYEQLTRIGGLKSNGTKTYVSEVTV